MFHKCAGCISHFHLDESLFQEVGLTSLDVLELSLSLVSLLRQSVALQEGKKNNRVDSLDADPQRTLRLTATKTQPTLSSLIQQSGHWNQKLLSRCQKVRRRTNSDMTEDLENHGSS